MKKPLLSILLASFILGLLAVCWSRAQTGSGRLKILDDKGAEVHTLMGDHYNALVGHLEAAGETNAIEMFRQYRCAYNADRSSSELRDIVAALQHLRGGRTNEAIQLLEGQLNLHASFLCNSYGCLSPTIRVRMSLESLEQADDYYAKFRPPKWSAEMEKGVNVILKPRRDAETEKAINEILKRKK
jgi:hypothetical protein